MLESAITAPIAPSTLEGIADSLSASSASLSPTCAHRSIRLVPATVALLLLLLLTLLHWYVDDLLLLSGPLLPLALHL